MSDAFALENEIFEGLLMDFATQQDQVVVNDFVGDDIWEEMDRRILDGQTIGQAFINAGDHADAPYHYEMPADTINITEWYMLVRAIQYYQLSLSSCAHTGCEADMTSYLCPNSHRKLCVDHCGEDHTN
jgi:hypothetical protein